MISLPEYEEARDHGRRFLVAPGHTEDDSNVISRGRRVWLVEKDGDAARVAENLDPRQRSVETKLPEREERIGKNEILLREVNERIEELSSETHELPTVDFVCECGDETCTKQVTLELETVVERHDRYQVVEKNAGPPGQLAGRTDPR